MQVHICPGRRHANLPNIKHLVRSISNSVFFKESLETDKSIILYCFSMDLDDFMIQGLFCEDSPIVNRFALFG